MVSRTQQCTVFVESLYSVFSTTAGAVETVSAPDVVTTRCRCRACALWTQCVTAGAAYNSPRRRQSSSTNNSSSSWKVRILGNLSFLPPLCPISSHLVTCLISYTELPPRNSCRTGVTKVHTYNLQRIQFITLFSLSMKCTASWIIYNFRQIFVHCRNKFQHQEFNAGAKCWWRILL